MVLGHDPSSHCHLSMNQVSFKSHVYFPRYGSDRNPLWKIRLMGDNSVIYRVGLWFLYNALHLTAIYL